MSTDRLGRLANLTLEATATLPTGPRPVRSLNDPTDVGANQIAAYTPLWGSFTRTRGVQGATDIAEVIVTDGKVASINPRTAGAGELPANSFALVGRENGATALRALQLGDAVSLAYDLKSDIADRLTFAVGGNVILVSGGVPQPGAGGELAPRTAIGFKNGGKTLLLVTADGRQSLVLGPTVRQTAELMADSVPRQRSTSTAAAPPRWSPARSGTRSRRSATSRPTAASAATRTASASSSRPATARCTTWRSRRRTRASSPVCAAASAPPASTTTTRPSPRVTSPGPVAATCSRPRMSQAPSP